MHVQNGKHREHKMCEMGLAQRAQDVWNMKITTVKIILTWNSTINILLQPKWWRLDINYMDCPQKLKRQDGHGWVERWTIWWYYTLTQPWMGGKVDNLMVLHTDTAMDGWKGGQLDGITHRHSHGWVERWTIGWYYNMDILSCNCTPKIQCNNIYEKLQIRSRDEAWIIRKRPTSPAAWPCFPFPSNKVDDDVGVLHHFPHRLLVIQEKWLKQLITKTSEPVSARLLYTFWTKAWRHGKAASN